MELRTGKGRKQRDYRRGKVYWEPGRAEGGEGEQTGRRGRAQECKGSRVAHFRSRGGREGEQGVNTDLQWLVSRHEQPTHLPAEGRGKKQATQHFPCNT